ncbi:uncharacterized protein LOC132938539 [Metopolophium dirhodum]|uniref:uncharacterized protein LOC132934802 n=1 Tax=Metopolophium dirhodum TaxID=44670 RepID=UPI00298FF7A1|nr:uncharacterized protein LOC132934802 [Metopolophium dirhodum]XP_060861421.1 uncharacterized protein LOC132938539 [Metopolophium dirhodum]XP_060861422.1 uncharacterized protein LOC132938539 [Metopolophium dirhodum]
MQHQKEDYLNLFRENLEDERIYTELQLPSCSSISNDERLVECPNIMDNFSQLSPPSHDISPKPYHLSFEDQNILKDMLLGWNMEYLYETCLAECIDVEALQSISTIEVEQLLSKYPMGVKIKFKKNLKQLQNKPEEVTVDVRNTSTVSTLSFSNLPVQSICHISPQFSLHDVLSNSSHGVMITNYYKSNKSLNESCRSLMIDLIISSLIEQSISMSVGLADTIAKTIVETFTTELKETYFVRDTDNKAPKGKLYAKYFNKIRSLKNHGLVSQGPLKKRKLEKNSLTRISAAFNDELVVEEDPERYISQLNHDELSWPDIEIIWKKTAVYRLKSLKMSATDLHNTWPHYKKPLGYKLVDIDFQCLQKEASNMLNIFDDTKLKVIQVLNQRLKDPSNKKLYNYLIDNSQVTESSKSCIILYLLHAILIPTNKKSSTDTQGKKTIVKYSIQDSQNSFMMIAPTAVEVEEMIKRKYNVGDTIQPCIIIIGTIREPLEVLVFFDSIKYKVFSPIKALDICFKIFHVFNIEYPIESINVWLFVQKLYYNIVNKYDKPCPLVNQIVSEIKF